MGVVLLLASPSGATVTSYVGTLAGINENPTVATPGTGTAFVTYDSTAHTLSINVTFSGLVGNTTAAHIHCCAVPPANAGVAVHPPSLAGFPLGVTSGAFNNTFDLTLAPSWSPTFIANNGGTPASAEAALAAGLAAGQAYFNIHTAFRPGGEIRDFLEQQPEPIPTTTAIGLAALVALLAFAAVIALRRG